MLKELSELREMLYIGINKPLAGGDQLSLQPVVPASRSKAEWSSLLMEYWFLSILRYYPT